MADVINLWRKIMHTFKATRGTVFNYNSDMSGDVIISSNDINKQCVNWSGVMVLIEIPTFDILEFVAEVIRIQQISKLEQMDVCELLDL